MKCAVCKQELSNLMGAVKIDQNISTHLECFFEDIPNPPSRMEKDYEKKNVERSRLIEEKVEKIIKQYQ